MNCICCKIFSCRFSTGLRLFSPPFIQFLWGKHWIALVAKAPWKFDTSTFANSAIRIKNQASHQKLATSLFLKLRRIACLTLFDFPEIKIEFISHKGLLLRLPKVIVFKLNRCAVQRWYRKSSYNKAWNSLRRWFIYYLWKHRNLRFYQTKIFKSASWVKSSFKGTIATYRTAGR